MLALADSPVSISDILGTAMRLRRISERSLALYLGFAPSTVNRYRRGVATPDPAQCRIIAQRLGLTEAEVLRAAGHMGAEPEAIERADPPWLANLIAELRQVDLTPREADVLDATVQGLLALREERALYEAQEPPSPEAPA